MAKFEDPPGWADLSDDDVAEMVNGCGPEGYSHRIPDELFGADFSGACNRHDVEYARATHRRSEIDARFKRNLYAAASSAPWFMRPLAMLAARIYYRAVRLGGDEHYEGPE